ncbi:helix-turn-helix domain-containing protein [Microvirga makkahensis]|uniref:Helix-turn-helix domain-containing protein n=1 Tax=Microvirga makkahensis TaxID=1128670 RepID=A0A7X3MVP4_9HYPH|nr:helix-turn-helix domain-containing protein [Microvirga makkahensis]MXQ14077.1 helix-turn-helix domain-containing protein [Microvirga makkahensis]
MPRAYEPILASRPGRYVEARPVARLLPHFQSVWMSSVSPDHSGPVVVVPDGCFDLLWREGRFTVVGPDIAAATPELRPGSIVLGIRFTPGAAAKWLGQPLAEIIGREVPMAEFWSGTADRVADGIGVASSVGDKLRVLQEFPAAEAPEVEHPRQGATMIFEFPRSDASAEGRKIMALRERLGISERTLRRQCDEFFGYGPKTFARILRFQRFQVLARTNADEGLSPLALRAGYADQAHLTREVQSLCGMTAGEFVRQVAA